MVDIRQSPMGPGASLRDFLDVVELVYEDDPRYVRPLDMELKDRLDRMLAEGEAALAAPPAAAARPRRRRAAASP